MKKLLLLLALILGFCISNAQRIPDTKLPVKEKQVEQKKKLVDATIDLLIKLGELAEDEQILSIDLNPLIIVDGSPIAADALVELKDGTP